MSRRAKDVVYVRVYVCVAASNARRARRLPEIDSELARLLQSTMREVGGATLHQQAEANEVRKRKIDRMAAVRQLEQQKATSPFQDNANITVRKDSFPLSGTEKLT